MKKNYFIKLMLIVFTISTLSVFQSCTEDALIEQDRLSELKSSPVVDKLTEMGYKREAIVELTDFYLVQGDLMFSKNIDDYNKDDKKQGRHASTNNLVSQANAASMWVYIDPSLPTSPSDNDYWIDAISFAMQTYIGLDGSLIVLLPTPYISSADIIVKSDNNTLPNNTIAAAGFPSGSQPYNEVLINLDFDSNKIVASGSKSYNMIHEFGHCIGLRHTNWDIRGEGLAGVGANLIPGTPSQDPNSVMNGGTADNVFLGLSTYDVLSINYLYPQLIYVSSAVKNTGIFIRGGFNQFNVSGYPANSSIQWQHSTDLRVIYGGTTQPYLNMTTLSSAGNSGWVSVTVTPPSGGVFFEQINFTIQ